MIGRAHAVEGRAHGAGTPVRFFVTRRSATMSPAHPPLMLSVRDLTVVLNDRRVLERVSFELSAGESLAVLGPNGAGKTVLLKTLLGLLPPASGSVVWDAGARLAYVPQKIDADLHLPLTLRTLLESKARILRLPSSAAGRAAEAADIPAAVLRTPLGHLSGGQLQKSLIAFALLGEPDVILLDEPTASLDELAEAHVYELLRDLRERRGLTLVFVSHDLSVVPSAATRVLCLNKATVCYGTPQQALTPEVFARLYAAPHAYFRHVAEAHGHAGGHGAAEHGASRHHHHHDV